MILLLVLLIFLVLVLWKTFPRAHTHVEEYTDKGADGKGAMVIVEPRAHLMLPMVIREFDRVVPKDFTLYVVHGTSNATYARTAASNIVRPTVFIRLETDDLTADQYNALLTDPEFWKLIKAEHVLVFQTDSVPCGRPLDIDKFGRFGYIGCAYGDKAGRDTYWGTNAFYGVGGLSLRRKSFMQRCLANERKGPEDVAFSNCVEEFPEYSKPTARDISDFCAQNSNNGSRSWGAHQAKHMPSGERDAFRRQCPLSAFT